MEGLSWANSLYMSVTSVTTSVVAVVRAFLYLTELRMEKRNRRVATWCCRGSSLLGILIVAAGLDNNGSISKSEFVIYKLKEMGKIAEKDVMLICKQFERLDTGNCGKITLSDLMEHHHH